MLRRIELIELLSCIIENMERPQVSKIEQITMNEVLRIANSIEEEYPSIYVDVDKYSLESIKNKYSKAITIDNISIQIDMNDTTIITQIKRYQPSVEDKKRIARVLSKKIK